MKKLLFFNLFIFISISVFSQVQSYYNDVDLTKRGMDLKDELAVKITSTHTTHISYSELWDVLKQTDEASSDTSKVFLIYGWENGQDSDCHNDIMRDKSDNGGSAANCEWNREHVYPRSLGNPNLGSSGAGSDPHHVRPSDVSMNGRRGNKKFAEGSGHAGVVNSDFWYPGDEWKGDVARIIMYLYLRYGSQTLPSNVGTGPSIDSDSNMLELFLKWNAEDPPSEVEDQRNAILENLQGNRNPFIDNPYLATLIWGGTEAQDRWNMSIANERVYFDVDVYPNPADRTINIISHQGKLKIKITDTTGKIIYQKNNTESVSWHIEHLSGNVYFIYLQSDRGARSVKKLIVQ